MMSDRELCEFLQWCLPKLRLRWPGFRKVRRTVRKRLNRRIRDLGLENLAAYRRMLEADPAEWSMLDTICRIPISRFYRDKQTYDFLASKILPNCAVHACQRDHRLIKILSAGCASGEEPYSVSLIWHLRLAKDYPDCAINILAVDVDEEMLGRARTACYSPGAFKDLPADLLARGFQRTDDTYCLRVEFQDCVDLQLVDLRETVPDGAFDIILCRNTAFTYFDKATQALVSSNLDAALRPGGYLIIGAHETFPGEGQKILRLNGGSQVLRKPNIRR